MTGPGRTALVTGASAGIGAAIARALGNLGWRVALGARRVDRLQEIAREIETAGGRAFVHALDVSDPRSLDEFFDASEAELGGLDVLVSNAGLCIPGQLHEVRPDDLQKELGTNLLGPMLLARRAIQSMRGAGRGGDLIFVSSENAIRPRTYQAGYTATKWGLEGLASVLRMELEGTGIRATLVRPGPTRTEFGNGWKPDLIQEILSSWKHWGLQRHMKWLKPEDVAGAVVAALKAPAGAHMDVIEIMPEAPIPPGREERE